MPITLTNVDPPKGFSDQAEWRTPQKGESFMSTAEHLHGSAIDCLSDAGSPRIVLRRLKPEWTPPEFLQPGYVTRNQSGEFWWHKCEPVREYSTWQSAGLISRMSGVIDTSDWPTEEDGPWYEACWEVG